MPIEVSYVKEHEDGGATYGFDLDEESAVVVAELGLKLLLYCHACGKETQEVLDGLAQEVERGED